MDPEKYYEHQTRLYLRLIGPEWHLGLWRGAPNLQEAISSLTQFMADRLRGPAPERVLDVGCGVGASARYLSKRCGSAVVGVSNSRTGLAEAERATTEAGMQDRVSFQFADASSLPFSDHAFDAVWSCEALHNLADQDKALSEVCRVLKPGGPIVLGGFFQLRAPTPEAPITHGLSQWGFNLRMMGEWVEGLERNGVAVSESVNLGPDVAPSLPVCSRLFADDAPSHAEGSLDRIICERTAMATTALAGHFASNEIGWGVWAGAKR